MVTTQFHVEVFQCSAAFMQNASICLVTVTVESDFLFLVLGCKHQSL